MEDDRLMLQNHRFGNYIKSYTSAYTPTHKTRHILAQPQSRSNTLTVQCTSVQYADTFTRTQGWAPVHERK